MRPGQRPGILPLVTGALNFSPAYKLIGLNTCPRHQR
jgi:hypothetical protein